MFRKVAVAKGWPLSLGMVGVGRRWTVARAVGALALTTGLLIASLAGAGGAGAEITLEMGAVDVSRQAGVHGYMKTWSVNVGDFNRDGYQDALVPDHDPESYSRGEVISPPHMYVGGPGGFTDRRTVIPTGTDRHDCAWGDMNNDTRPDLFCAVGLTATSVNELWVQQLDGSFANRAPQMNITQNTKGRYRTATFIDANGDGWQDIFVTRYSGSNGEEQNPLPPEDPRQPNELWINTQSGTSRTFQRNTSMGIALAQSAGRFNNQCTQRNDYNEDGKDDLLLCTEEAIHLFENNGSNFTDVAVARGISGNWADAELAHLNGDGLLDLVQIKGTTLRIMMQQTDRTFRQVFNTPMTTGLNVAVGDFDGNGHQDVYAIGSCPLTGTVKNDAPDKIVYNEGGSFRVEQLPAIMPQGGCGNDVAALDYNKDGRDEFLVVNGRAKNPGPTQLWTWAAKSSATDTYPPDTTDPYANLRFGDTVGAGGTVPTNIRWLGSDASGISRFTLERSNDGGSSFSRVSLPALARQYIPLLPPGGGPYQFRLSATDTVGNTSTPVMGETFGVALEQETDPRFSFTGSWTPQAVEGASGGSVMSSSTPGDSAVFTTPLGTRWVGIVSNKGPDRGRTLVYYDGALIANIDHYAASPSPRRIMFERGVRPGTQHTVRVVVRDTINPSSTGTRIDIDGVARIVTPGS